MHRLFVALRPPPAIRALLADLMDGVPDARWQDDEQLHVTVRYIGEVNRRHAEDIVATLATVVAPTITARLTGVGSFGRQGSANSLWVALSPVEPLAALHHKVDQALVRTGLPPEGRAYRPHITVARLSNSAGRSPAVAEWLAAHAALSGPEFRVQHLVLYESHVGQHGARYEAVARWPFGDYCAGGGGGAPSGRPGPPRPSHPLGRPKP